MRRVRGCQQHAVGLDAPHVARLEVAEHHHQAVLQLSLRHVAHQAGADLPQLRLPNVHLLHKQLLRLGVLPRLDDAPHAHVESAHGRAFALLSCRHCRSAFLCAAPAAQRQAAARSASRLRTAPRCGLLQGERAEHC